MTCRLIFCMKLSVCQKIYSKFQKRKACQTFWSAHPLLRSSAGTVMCWSCLARIDGLAQDCSNSIASALELLQSCIKPSIYRTRSWSVNSIIMIKRLLSFWQLKLIYRSQHFYIYSFHKFKTYIAITLYCLCIQWVFATYAVFIIDFWKLLWSCSTFHL